MIVRRNAPDALVMPLDKLNCLMATVHLLKSPSNGAHLVCAILKYRESEVRQQVLVDVD